MRGIVPTQALIALEAQLGGRVRDYFDMVAGTSTGALLAAAVAAGIPATAILDVYVNRSKEIFTPTGPLATVKRGLRGWMYDPKNLHAVMVDVLGLASGWLINDCPIRVMITAVGMNGHDWYFVKDNPQNKGTTGKVPLVDAAVASACAPTYFKWWPVTVQGQTLPMFDGGAGGNANPSLQACREAFEYDTFRPAETRVFDLGTGYYPAKSDPPSGLLGTIGWATSTLVDSSEDDATTEVNARWPGILRTLDVPLLRDISEDDLGAIPELVADGKQFADTLDWKGLLAA